jgi:hypothetical protein
MTLSYLALALAIVLLLAGIAGTAFTFRTIAQRHAEHSHDIETPTWHGISAPVHAFQSYYLMSYYTGRRHKPSVVAYYVTLSVAAIAKMAVSLTQIFSK